MTDVPAKFKNMLMKNLDKISAVATKQVDPNKLIQILGAAANRNPKLYSCTPASIIQTAMMASELGLTVGGSLGHLYPVPYGKTCVPIIGYRGLIKLAMRSGNIATIEARNVYENDEFRIEYNADPPFVHRPALRSNERGDYIGSYCVSKTKDNFVQFSWMDVDEVMAIKNRSKAAKSGPWVTDFGEMCRKTVTKRHIKYLDLTVEVAASISQAEEAEIGEIIKDVTPVETSAENDVKDALGIETEAEPEPEPDEETGFEEFAGMEEQDIQFIEADDA